MSNDPDGEFKKGWDARKQAEFRVATRAFRSTLEADCRCGNFSLATIERMLEAPRAPEPSRDELIQALARVIAAYDAYEEWDDQALHCMHVEEARKLLASVLPARDQKKERTDV